jgi:hypothetical protein
MAPKALARERDTSTFGTILSRIASTNGTWTSNIVPPATARKEVFEAQEEAHELGILTSLGKWSVLKNICL